MAPGAERNHQLYTWLAGMFVAALIVADLIGGRFFRIAGHDLSAGMLAFPITFLLTDAVNEFYGAAATRRLTYLGLGAALLSFGVINLALALTPSPESPLSDEAFRQTFGWSMRLYVASLVAYVVGQLIDIGVFTFLKQRTGKRMLWLRATGSTVVGQAIDTVVVNAVLLGGVKSAGFIGSVIVDSYVIKLVVAIGLTPLVYLLHGLLERMLRSGRSDRAGDPLGMAEASPGE